MLTRADRILAEIVVSRGRVARETIEGLASRAIDAGFSLSDLLVLGGHISPDEAGGFADEAAAVERAVAQGGAPGRLGEFRIVREIGRGGMGIVYEALWEPRECTVALKVLPAGAALDERLRKRFHREAQAVSRLSHPGIVPVLASGEAEGALYFAMDLVRGRSLDRVIDEAAVPPESAARIASEVARALACAHRDGLIHRDVKPSNVLIDGAGRARLVDFGLVHIAGDDSLTRTAAVLGTPAFIAPEQARGEPAGPACDVYGVGAILYTMLAGRPPFLGEVPSVVLAHVLIDSPPPLLQMCPRMPRVLAGVCEKAMAHSPADRYSSAEALADDLDRFLNQEPTQAEPSRVPSRRTPFRLRMLVAGCALASLSTAFVIWSTVSRLAPSNGELVPDAALPRMERAAVATLGNASAESGRPRIEWVGDRYAAAWVGEQDTVQLAWIDRRGRLLGPPLALSAPGRLGENVDLASAGRRVAAVWDERGTGPGEASLRLVLLDPSGGPRAERTLGGPGARHPRVAWSGSDLAVAWQEPSGCGYDIRVAMTDPNGHPIAATETVATCGDEPVLESIGSTFLLAWHDRIDHNIYVTRRTMLPGAGLAPRVMVSERGPSDHPALSAGTGGFVVAWHHVRWEKDWVFCRAFDESLKPLGGEGQCGSESSVWPGLTRAGDRFALAFDEKLRAPPSSISLRWLSSLAEQSTGLPVMSGPGPADIEPDVAWSGRDLGLVWKRKGGEGGFFDVRFVRVLICEDGDADGRNPCTFDTKRNPNGGDCDDTHSAVGPGAPERCNGTDDDCDGSVDEGCPSA